MIFLSSIIFDIIEIISKIFITIAIIMGGIIFLMPKLPSPEQIGKAIVATGVAAAAYSQAYLNAQAIRRGGGSGSNNDDDDKDDDKKDDKDKSSKDDDNTNAKASGSNT
jgi:hypothetical protein